MNSLGPRLHTDNAHLVVVDPPGAHMSQSATLQAMASDQHLPSCVLLGDAPGVLKESEGGYRAPRMPGRALQVLSHPNSFRNHQMS